MTALQSSNATPHHTFLEKKPPLLPRQSTSDVLSFTHIIANRLEPGQTVWEFFSPPPSSTATPPATANIGSATASAPSGCTSPPISPTASNFLPPSPATTPSTETPPPTTTTATAAAPANTKATNRRSLLFFGSLTKSSPALDIQETTDKNDSGSSGMNNNTQGQPSNGPLSPVSPTGPSTGTTENNVAHYAQSATAEPTPKAQKRKSFAQSLRSMLSLSSLLSSSSSKAASPPLSASPPHYNILVLGSDSAPLASTLYKMSGVLPGASKIGHYQEISGFFVAYFKSDGSFSCSPPLRGTIESEPTKTRAGEATTATTTTTASTVTKASPAGAESLEVDAKVAEEVAALVVKRASDVQSDEIKSRRRSSGEYAPESAAAATEGGVVVAAAAAAAGDDSSSMPRSSAESMSTLVLASSSSSSSLTTPMGSSACSSTDDLSLKLSTAAVASGQAVSDGLHRVETLVDEDEVGRDSTTRVDSSATTAATATDAASLPPPPQVLSPSANASLSIHAFSVDTTWPVPRILAQTFWFPHAHGIIYVVDATRKNDPRGMDHLLNARQFLASLVSDPFFKRADIPVVVFANKAGVDESCFRVDEIAEILGCEEWDEANPCPHGLNGNDSAAAGGAGSSSMGGSSPSLLPTGASNTLSAAASSAPPRPWCVKSTRADGSGDGLRESVEWLKSRMGEVWKS
ncbi:hypothetical protein BGZ73_004424 [Actinomortierella ambigua]|nr:hypothetical protein BGZ73_004424 [Actinomortierella ambigua]